MKLALVKCEFLTRQVRCVAIGLTNSQTYKEADVTDGANPKIKSSVCHLDKFFDLMQSHVHKIQQRMS